VPSHLSQSKLDKGDATWSTHKRILGWDLDTSTMTLQLPAHRLIRLHDAIQTFLQLRRTSRRKWHQFLGELGLITGASIFAQHTTHLCPSLLSAVEKTPAFAWTTKGSTTSTAVPAFLLHLLAQQSWSYLFKLSPIFTMASTNTVADFCSRSFALTDVEFLDQLNHRFTSQHSWQLAQSNSEILYKVNYALSRRMPPWASPPPEEQLSTQHGPYGMPSAWSSTKMHTYKTLMTPSPCYKSLADAIVMESWLPEVLRSAVEQ
jgi:hypothetical protein